MKSKLPMGMAVCGLLMTALLVGRSVVLAQGGGITLNPAQVLGPNVTFTWSGSGATNYVLRAGVAPGQYLASINLGNTTTFAVAAPALGTYYVRVDGDNGTFSNEISFQVVSMFVPPAAPTDLTTYLNGQSAVITWNPGAGGGATSAFVLQAGTAPGAADVGQFPLSASATSLLVPFVPPGTYYLRVVGLNQGGAGAPSNEAVLAMPAGGGCSAPPARAITPMVFGQYVRLSWPIVPGAAGYLLNYTGTHAGSSGVPGNAGSVTVPRAPLGVYQAALTTVFSCGQSTTGPATTITVDGAPPPGPRRPNPAPGTLLPRPNMSHVVEQLAAERRDLLLQSCREHGGNNRFLFELVRRLRAIDNRWGLNWKRGNFGDMSQDIVAYNGSDQSDEGARTPAVFIFDVIGGHCGSNPGPNWGDVTDITIERGTVGVWTLLPYLDAGYPIVSDQQ